MDDEKLIEDVLDWVRRSNVNPKYADGGVTRKLDLFAAGVLDSLTFVDLLVHIEERTSRSLDLSEVEPEELATVEGLCRCVNRDGSG